MPGDPGDGGINSPGIKGDHGVDGLPGPQVKIIIQKNLVVSYKRQYLNLSYKW